MQQEFFVDREQEQEDRQRSTFDQWSGQTGMTRQDRAAALPPPLSTVPAAPEQAVWKRLARPQLLLCLGLGILLALLVFSGPLGASITPQPPVTNVGQMVLSSSGQLDPTSSTGLNDTLTLTLHHLSPPAPGTHYVAWLIPNAMTAPMVLGTLLLTNGTAQLTYVQPEHRNLLATWSGVRITQERNGTLPHIPSTDPTTWRYVALIPSTPTPGDESHYSLLDHLRHLLASDPTLDALGLSGGLGIWLYRNIGKLFEWSNAARDNWAGGQSTGLIHRHMLRILDTLDGAMYVWRDVPVGSPFLADLPAAQIGLLSFAPDQNPPGYLQHVLIHLQGVAASPGRTSAQASIAQGLQQALGPLTTLLQHMRQDALHLVTMTDAELQQPHALSLLDDMTTAATTAYAGQGATNGVVWMQQQMAQLVVLPVTTVAGGNSTSQLE